MAPGTVQLNSFSWNRNLARYVKAWKPEKTIELFQEMQQKCLSPDSFNFVPVLNACGNLGAHAHQQIIRSGCESDGFVGCSLVDIYAKCGSMEDSQIVFNKMPSPDVVTWNALIVVHVKCGQEGQKALELFSQMCEEGVGPNSVNFLGVLNACASLVTLEEGRRAHEQIIESGLDSDVIVGCSLFNMYAKCGSREDAWRVFNKLASQDMVTWTAMILGHVKFGQVLKALELFQQMQKEDVRPNSVTFCWGAECMCQCSCT
jgi:pentatricopeptide repeat protein